MKQGAPLKRKAPLKAKKPMSRGTSTMKSKAPMQRAQIGQLGKSADKPKRKALRTRGPKMTPIRKAARGQDCTINIPGVCNFNPETTVLCHDNRLSSGKGMGLKAPDEQACFGCSACHDVLDGRRPRPEWLTYDMLLVAFDAAMIRTHKILKTMGILK